MARRGKPAPPGPLRPNRPSKVNKEREINSELRKARASRKAETLQKQSLRRNDWDNKVEEVTGDEDDDDVLFGEDPEASEPADEDEDENADEK